MNDTCRKPFGRCQRTVVLAMLVWTAAILPLAGAAEPGDGSAVSKSFAFAWNYETSSVRTGRTAKLAREGRIEWHKTDDGGFRALFDVERAEVTHDPPVDVNLEYDPYAAFTATVIWSPDTPDVLRLAIPGATADDRTDLSSYATLADLCQLAGLTVRSIEIKPGSNEKGLPDEAAVKVTYVDKIEMVGVGTSSRQSLRLFDDESVFRIKPPVLEGGRLTITRTMMDQIGNLISYERVLAGDRGLTVAMTYREVSHDKAQRLEQAELLAIVRGEPEDLPVSYKRHFLWQMKPIVAKDAAADEADGEQAGRSRD